MNSHSLRFRVTRWYAEMLAVSILLFGATVYFGLRTFLYASLTESLKDDARAIGERILEDPRVKNLSFVSGEIEEAYAPSSNGLFIRVTRADGSLMYRSSAPSSHSFDPEQVIFPATLRPPVSHCSGQVAGSQQLMVCALPYTTGDHTHYLIETGSTYGQIHETMQGLAQVFWFGSPLFVLLACLGAYVVMGRELKPVQALIERAEKISWREPNQRLPILRTCDELDQLSLALNRMLDRIEESFQHVRRFSADASHELRTPLTIIRGELETIVREHHCSPQTLDILGSSLEEAERLTRIADQLLVLSRLDAGDEQIGTEVVDLGMLSKNTGDQMRLLSEEKQLSLEFDLEPGVRVQGSTSRLKQVVVNLLDNAIKYSKPGGHIRISVRASESAAWLEVSDDGVGIPAGSLPHVFERFYRADRARSRETGGSGLGLSIAQAIAKVHGGALHVTSTEGVGTGVTLELPRILPVPEQSQEAPIASIKRKTSPRLA
jgi:heavy metal sensor kinase